MVRLFLFTFIIFFNSVLTAVPAISSFEMPVRVEPQYISPTKRFNAYHNYEVILQILKTHGLSLEHRNFFEHIIPHEELGFFGYHSSTQGFRIFQDIIRLVLEEMCEIPIRKDFHFLRVPGKSCLNRQSAKEFLKDYPFVNDHNPDQKEQLLSMNYTLFGNFNNFGECSVYWFTTNSSASKVGFQIQLNDFFESLGVPTDTLPDLFTIGENLLVMNNAVLYQFFDVSHHYPFQHPYELVAKMCYESQPGGIPNLLNKKLMSENYLGMNASPFPAQFRLVINNSLILNPYSPLHIQRYERINPELVREYETHLRNAIRNLPFDKTKAAQYRKLLLSLWGQEDET